MHIILPRHCVILTRLIVEYKLHIKLSMLHGDSSATAVALDRFLSEDDLQYRLSAIYVHDLGCLQMRDNGAVGRRVVQGNMRHKLAKFIILTAVTMCIVLKAGKKQQ